MKCHWLLTRYSSITELELQHLYDLIVASGRTAEIRNFGWMKEYLDVKSDEQSCVFILGTCDITKSVGKQRPNLVPGSWHEPYIFKCSNYYSYLGEWITQKEYTFLPLNEVKRLKDKLFAQYGVKETIFIRPDSGDKEFNGELVNSFCWHEWVQMLETSNVPVTTMCVVAKPVEIIREYRLIIRRGKVVTGSLYRIDGEIELNALEEDKFKDGIIAFAESIANETFPDIPPVYVMDLAMGDGRVSLLEIGAISCAGFYKCDLKKIVDAVNEEAEAEYEEYFGQVD